MKTGGSFSLCEIVDSNMEFDAVYIKLLHPEGDGYLLAYPPITSIDDLLPRLMDLSLKSYRFIHADYSLRLDYLSEIYLCFVPTKDHSTNIDGDFIDLVSRIKILKPLDTPGGNVV